MVNGHIIPESGPMTKNITLDNLDRRILAELQKDSSRTVAETAKAAGTSPTPA